MSLKLDQVRTFIAVAESGSLSDAAKIMNRTSSAVSMSLKQFTEQLGNELFETDRKSTLTTLGHFVLEQSRTAVKDFDDSMATIHRYARGNFGMVRIASVPSFSTQLLPEIAEKFSKEFPGVYLELRDIDSDSINQVVRNNIVDIGIASNLGVTHDLKTELLLEEPFGVVCRADHEFNQYRDPIEWEQLGSQQFISNNLCKLINRSYLEQLCENSKVHIHNIATILSFIVAGFGITLLPRTAVADHYGLCFLPLQDKSAVRQLFIVQNKQHRLNPAAHEFKQQIKKYIQAKQSVGGNEKNVRNRSRASKTN